MIHRQGRIEPLARALAAAEARIEELAADVAGIRADAAQARLLARIDCAERVIAASRDGEGVMVSVLLPTRDRPRVRDAIASVRAGMPRGS